MFLVADLAPFKIRIVNDRYELSLGREKGVA